ncbi:glycosyltransferase family 4 protein [Massilia sp. RP-1-19]|uniref:Glycosyltransferase family 4 protein n=1 Tax=Massilia polaris TaxID=2728846 RepID=A0A848HP79_9BURK|nr:glycosyltransferase [Massilia polaris]NML61939.1 glycosyltransferase family 4 protein [Massilia polaris]
MWTKVHKNLYTQLDRLGVQQDIFTPLRKHSDPANNRIDFTVAGSALRFSGVLSGYHRVLFKQKICKLYRDLDAFGIAGQCDLVHATTLFSDGALAYELFRKYGKPYVVAVRNTDINMFLKYKPHLVFLARKILDSAQRLVFISQSNFDNFFKHPLVAMFAGPYRAKAVVINNGIAQLWLENLHVRKRPSASHILFIGRFDRNKNAVRLIEAFLALRQLRPGIRLSLVGSAGSRLDKVRRLAARHAGCITFYGPVAPGPELLQICRACDIFAMVSHHETFGLVYVEALSQGLPVLFSKGQGIDGTFTGNVGLPVDPSSVQDIGRGLERMIDNYPSFDLSQIGFERFGWESIAARYLEMYRAILSSAPAFR